MGITSQSAPGRATCGSATAYGLPSSNHQVDGAVAEAGQQEELRSLLRGAARDTKVIFGAHRGVFDLQRQDIENFFHLVDQRVKEQTGCKADYSEVGVYYSDGTSRRFPSIGEFSNYSETAKRFPTVVTLRISYYLEFPDSREPELQEIDIVIRTSESTTETLDLVMNDSRIRLSGDKIQMGIGPDASDLGIVTYTINHSRTTWGLDLENHIRGHIEKLLIAPTRGDVFLRRAAGPLNLITTLLVGLYVVNLIIDLFFAFLYQSDGAGTPDQILQTAATYLVNGHIAKYIVVSLVVSVVFFVLFSGFVSALTNSFRRPKPSFICLDPGDETRKTEKLSRYEKRWTRFFYTIAMDVVVAVLITQLESRITSLFVSGG